MNRDDLVLDHIGRYTITLRKVIEALYFEGGSSGSTLNRLVKQDLIERKQNGLAGNYSYYQLTVAGAKSRGIPVNRAREKKEKGLAQDLAALWFSCMNDVRRKRLNTEELTKLFGAPKGGNVIHVAQDDEDETTVFRLFVTSGGLTAFSANLRRAANDSISDERLLRWIERGTYRFAVLVENEERGKDLARRIREEEFPDLRIHIETAPTPLTLPRYFSEPEGDSE